MDAVVLSLVDVEKLVEVTVVEVDVVVVELAVVLVAVEVDVVVVELAAVAVVGVDEAVVVVVELVALVVVDVAEGEIADGDAHADVWLTAPGRPPLALEVPRLVHSCARAGAAKAAATAINALVTKLNLIRILSVSCFT